MLKGPPVKHIETSPVVQDDLAEKIVYVKYKPPKVEEKGNGRRLAVLGERTVWALVLGLVLTAGLQFMWMQKGLTKYQYVHLRHDWHHNADMVLAGDSRVMQGVSPAVLKQTLSGRILNHAKEGDRFIQDDFDRVASVLDPKSTARTIIAGITPMVFFESTTESEAEPETSESRGMQRILEDEFPQVAAWLQPWRNPIDCYYADGWMTRHTLSETLHEVERYRILYFKQNRVSSERVGEFLGQVKEWHQEGIRVVGFRPPSSREQVQVETEMSGFDYQDFAERFKAAGGVWLEVPQYRWATYDGVHMTREAAVDFSGYLAGEIERCLNWNAICELD